MLSMQTAEQTKADGCQLGGGIKLGEVVRPMVVASANCGQLLLLFICLHPQNGEQYIKTSRYTCQ